MDARTYRCLVSSAPAQPALNGGAGEFAEGVGGDPACGIESLRTTERAQNDEEDRRRTVFSFS